MEKVLLELFSPRGEKIFGNMGIENGIDLMDWGFWFTAAPSKRRERQMCPVFGDFNYNNDNGAVVSMASSFINNQGSPMSLNVKFQFETQVHQYYNRALVESNLEPTEF